MVEKKGLGKAIGHAFLWFGIAIVLFPLYIALVATTHTFDVLIGSTPLWFGGEFLKNFTTVLTQGLKAAGGIPVWVMMANSLVMALGIAIGKIAISITAAYAIVYFRFPGRKLCFVLIFITLMMPVEVRIVPTFQVAANLNFIDSYLGLVLPLIASATATFLYRQMFMTIPAELLEAARIDGAGPWRFFVDVVLPLSRTNTAALFVVLFLEPWKKPENRPAGVMGILCAAASLAVFGADNMVIPAMVLVLAVLLGARRRLDRSGEEGDL